MTMVSHYVYADGCNCPFCTAVLAVQGKHESDPDAAERVLPVHLANVRRLRSQANTAARVSALMGHDAQRIAFDMRADLLFAEVVAMDPDILK